MHLTLLWKTWTPFIFQGHMPTVQLLKKYDLMQFAEVTKSVRYDACFSAMCSKILCKKCFFGVIDENKGGIFLPSRSFFSHWGKTTSLFHFFILAVKEIFSYWMMLWQSMRPSLFDVESFLSLRSWKSSHTGISSRKCKPIKSRVFAKADSMWFHLGLG